MNEATVYLADLRHDYSGIIANDCMPLGVAYMKAVMDRDLPEVRSELHAYPEALLDAIRNQPPDVLMLSNYVWNEALSLHIATVAKRLRPGTLVVLGGPNIPIEKERQSQYLLDHADIDMYALGEGDFLAAEIVRHFLESGCSIGALGEREIPSCIYRRPDGSIAHTGTRERNRNLDEIPSPWLTGLLDKFFDGRLAPIMETNRGCPFTCTFCSQGTQWYTKVNQFSKERLREEIFYIARRINDLSPLMHILRLADSNYGMYERDAEISGYFGETQKLYGWPTYIDATTGKNRPERIIKSIEKVNGAMLLYQAVQSLDDDVLRNVKRQTIKMEAYEQLRVYVRGRGLRSNTDLILGLPGESYESHMRGIRKLLDAGLSRITNFQLMMLKGTELEQLETRKLFRFDTRFRILPKNYGLYGGEMVFDVEEIACATDTLPFEDYLRARRVALIAGFFWLDNYFDEVVRFVENLGVLRSEWFDAMIEAFENAPDAIRDYFAKFTEETTNELFPTRDACVEFYSEPANFERLKRGEVGDNLLHKYRAIAGFYIWPEMCAQLMDATRRLLEARGLNGQIADFGEFWNELHRFIDLRHARGETRAAILDSTETDVRYDIAGWFAAGMPPDTSAFRTEYPERVQFRLGDTSAHAMESALDTWTDELRGLTKMLARIQTGTQARECHFIRNEVLRAGAA
jgi:radical SAM superfamily enzyme YgiQ (UPF0313 family)